MYLYKQIPIFLWQYGMELKELQVFALGLCFKPWSQVLACLCFNSQPQAFVSGLSLKRLPQLFVSTMLNFLVLPSLALCSSKGWPLTNGTSIVDFQPIQSAS